MFQFQRQQSLFYLLFLVFTVGFQQCLGFAGTRLLVRTQSSTLMMYMPKQTPQTTPNDALQMIPNPSIGPTIREQQYKKVKQDNSQRRYTTELSNSVLHECNTLPSFPTAHGILSPETVMRMEEMVEFEGHSSEAVDRFLKQYRRHGPMSCLSMLSDPEVLPHLTKAMRNVV